jgi:hypothetical protein
MFLMVLFPWLVTGRRSGSAAERDRQMRAGTFWPLLVALKSPTVFAGG